MSVTGATGADGEPRFFLDPWRHLEGATIGSYGYLRFDGPRSTIEAWDPKTRVAATVTLTSDTHPWHHRDITEARSRLESALYEYLTRLRALLAMQGASGSARCVIHPAPNGHNEGESNEIVRDVNADIDGWPQLTLSFIHGSHPNPLHGIVLDTKLRCTERYILQYKRDPLPSADGKWHYRT